MVAIPIADPLSDLVDRLLRVDQIPFGLADSSIDQIINGRDMEFLFKFAADVTAADKEGLRKGGQGHILVIMTVDIMKDVLGQGFFRQRKGDLRGGKDLPEYVPESAAQHITDIGVLGDSVLGNFHHCLHQL